MVQYTKSLPLDEVIAYLQSKDLSQPENREMILEILLMKKYWINEMCA